jgi:hypothetical protein
MVIVGPSGPARCSGHQGIRSVAVAKTDASPPGSGFLGVSGGFWPRVAWLERPNGFANSLHSVPEARPEPASRIATDAEPIREFDFAGTAEGKRRFSRRIVPRLPG